MPADTPASGVSTVSTTATAEGGWSGDRVSSTSARGAGPRARENRGGRPAGAVGVDATRRAGGQLRSGRGGGVRTGRHLHRRGRSGIVVALTATGTGQGHGDREREQAATDQGPVTSCSVRIHLKGLLPRGTTTTHPTMTSDGSAMPLACRRELALSQLGDRLPRRPCPSQSTCNHHNWWLSGRSRPDRERPRVPRSCCSSVVKIPDFAPGSDRVLPARRARRMKSPTGWLAGCYDEAASSIGMPSTGVNCCPPSMSRSPGVPHGMSRGMLILTARHGRK
jgi:hypothetical protein